MTRVKLRGWPASPPLRRFPVVVNDDRRVTEQTRKRVQQAIDENGYVQNMNARNLRVSQFACHRLSHFQFCKSLFPGRLLRL